MKMIALLMTISVAAPIGLCSDPNVLTLPEALSLAMMHNPELAAYSWEVRAADAWALQAGLAPNPELEVEVEEVGGSGGRSGFDGAETTVQLSQRIERGGKRAKRRQAAELEKALSELDYQSKRLDLLSETSKAFYRVLAAQENLTLLEQLLELSMKQADAVGQRVEAGKDMPLEHNKAQVAYSQVRIQYRQAQNLLEDARRQLAAQWNQRELSFEKAHGSLEEVGDLPEFDALAQRLGQNPDIVRWETELESSRAQQELEKSNRRQDWTVSAGMQRFNETDDNAVVFGLSIPLPVFDRNQGAVAAARYRTRRVEEQQKAAEARIHANLSKAYASLTGAFAEVSESRKHVLQNAKQAFEHAQEAWRQGKIDYLHVLDAQRTYFESQVQYVDALAAFHEAQADIRRLTGAPVLPQQMNTDIKEEQTHE